MIRTPAPTDSVIGPPTATLSTRPVILPALNVAMTCKSVSPHRAAARVCRWCCSRTGSASRWTPTAPDRLLGIARLRRHPAHPPGLGVARSGSHRPARAADLALPDQDLVTIVDNLDAVIAAVPGLPGRVDRSRIAATGHSYGATTASALLGARVLPPAGDAQEDFTDSRIRAGVLLSLAGLAGNDLTPIATQFFPFMNPSFEHFSAPRSSPPPMRTSHHCPPAARTGGKTPTR